ncbi:MAG TPA: hypothetical protein VLH79_09370 [Chthonomonadales bacterium]|nr:hypothetical protein [Chthonomonadales bacterium]
MNRNPLAEYRRAQREVRRAFDPFTRRFCSACVTPCCVRPARVQPADILLAASAGWRPPDGIDAAVARAAEGWMEALLPAGEGSAPEPCEYLGPGGCTFPDDLRPFGCTAYLCPIMHAELDRPALDRLRRLVRRLEAAHGDLMARLERPTGNGAEEQERPSGGARPWRR